MRFKCEHCQGDGWTVEVVGEDMGGNAIEEQQQCRWCLGKGYQEVAE